MSAHLHHDPGGLSLGPLMIAGVLASPALWRAVEQHQLPLYVALERLLVIAVICVVVGDVVKRYLDVAPTSEAAAATPATAATAATAATPATAASSASEPPTAPMPFEQTAEWGAGDLDATDLFALEPLPGEDPHPAIG